VLGVKDVPDQPHDQDHEREEGKNRIRGYGEREGMGFRLEQVLQSGNATVPQHSLPWLDQEMFETGLGLDGQLRCCRSIHQVLAILPETRQSPQAKSRKFIHFGHIGIFLNKILYKDKDS